MNAKPAPHQEDHETLRSPWRRTRFLDCLAIHGKSRRCSVVFEMVSTLWDRCLTARDPVPIQHRLQVEHRHLSLGREPDEGTVVGIFRPVGEVPIESNTEQAQAGGAAVIVRQGSLERVDVRSIRCYCHLGHGRFVDTAQPLRLRDSLLVGVHGSTGAGGHIAQFVRPGDRRDVLLLLRSIAQELSLGSRPSPSLVAIGCASCQSFGSLFTNLSQRMLAPGV